MNEASCPVERALTILGPKWRVVILARIKEGAQRYADLRRLVPRMSEKMLTQRLRELAADGLISRRDGRYVLTPRGESARGVLQALYDWGSTLEASRAPGAARPTRPTDASAGAD